MFTTDFQSSSRMTCRKKVRLTCSWPSTHASERLSASSPLVASASAFASASAASSAITSFRAVMASIRQARRQSPRERVRSTRTRTKAARSRTSRSRSTKVATASALQAASASVLAFALLPRRLVGCPASGNALALLARSPTSRSGSGTASSPWHLTCSLGMHLGPGASGARVAAAVVGAGGALTACTPGDAQGVKPQSQHSSDWSQLSCGVALRVGADSSADGSWAAEDGVSTSCGGGWATAGCTGLLGDGGAGQSLWSSVRQRQEQSVTRPMTRQQRSNRRAAPWWSTPMGAA
mmetsp:Transcript_65203/g.206007  ORF Transcript_65203/g.206007 Transcript_65203/m.206007 type:complete len:295 (+) Transcript_65203:202-1086(+)